MNEVTLAGVDLTPRIVKWDNLEEVKTVLLGQAAMFTSEVTLTFENADRALSPASSASAALLDAQSYAFAHSDGVGKLRYNSGNQIHAMTITPARCMANGVSLQIRKFGVPVGNIWVELQGATAAGPDGVVHRTSKNRRVEDLTAAAFPPGTRFWWPEPFQFDGAQYALVIRSDIPISVANYVDVYKDGSTPTYAGGNWWRYTGAWFSEVNSDIVFELFAISSLFAGVDWYGKPLTITRDDERNLTLGHTYAFTNNAANALMHYNVNNQDFGQVVTPPADPINVINFEMLKIGAPVGYMWLEWQGVSGGVNDGVIHARSRLRRVEGLTGGILSEAFVFDQPLRPDGVSQYALLIRSDIPISTTDYIRVRYDNTGTYAGGTLLRETAAGFVTGAGFDIGFEFYSYDHITLFEGATKNIKADPKRQITTITAENVFKVIAETRLVRHGTDVTPAAAILGMLRTVLSDDQIDVASFVTSDEQARTASATITYRYVEEDETTIMAAIEAIADLASLVVYVHDNKIYCQRFRVYQGSEAELKYELTDSIVREWGAFTYDVSSFSNEVTVGYTADDLITRTDAESVRKNGVTRAAQFDGSEQLSSTDDVAAIYFADRYLERGATRRAMLQAAGGVELEGVRLGDRFPVSPTGLGLSRFPMEAIQVNRKLGTDDVELTLVELVAQ